jgi:hypothetical protein
MRYAEYIERYCKVNDSPCRMFNSITRSIDSSSHDKIRELVGKRVLIGRVEAEITHVYDLESGGLGIRYDRGSLVPFDMTNEELEILGL